MQIHGVVVTRNDWGMLPVSIAHALTHHVDVVHVLNHASDDQTASGLAVLKEIWAERLFIYSTGPESPYQQALLTNMVAFQAEKQGADWIYVFDSDEFLLAKPRISLRDRLSGLGPEVVAARYRLSNFISTHDFNKSDLTCYQGLVYKSLPGAIYVPDQAWDAIEAGQQTFFDIPFPPKLIFRANEGLHVATGCHTLAWRPARKVIANIPELECAHLTLPSKDVLFRKAAQGASHIRQGDPKRRGWQAQLIHKLHTEGRLDWFWERHSIRAGGDATTQPQHVIDEALVGSLLPALGDLTKKFGGTDLSLLGGVRLASGPAKESAMGFDDVFQLCNYFDLKIKGLLEQLR